MRLPRSSFAAEAFWDSDEPETVVTPVPSAEQRRACRDQGVSAEPMRMRLVCVRLTGGEQGAETWAPTAALIRETLIRCVSRPGQGRPGIFSGSQPLQMEPFERGVSGITTRANTWMHLISIPLESLGFAPIPRQS